MSGMSFVAGGDPILAGQENTTSAIETKERNIAFDSQQHQANYGGFGLSLGYGHMTAEMIDNRKLVLRYYDVANVDVRFAVKMFVSFREKKNNL